VDLEKKEESFFAEEGEKKEERILTLGSDLGKGLSS